MNSTKHQYKITAIVSVYSAERFLKHCLEDLIAQSIFEQTQIIIIDANSPQDEKSIAQNFTKQYPNISYTRTKERETLYASWNRAIKMAKGQYLTNANADDRHAPRAFERLSFELDKNPNIALTYANCRITNKENSNFDSAPITAHLRWLAYDHLNLLRRCEIGPQPMWRKSVHDSLGFFNEKYTVTGDYDMWLRISEKYPFKHIPEELGLYLQYDNNLETQNPEQTQKEYIQVQTEALQRFMSNDFCPHMDFAEQLKEHRARIERYLLNLENGSRVKNQNKLAYHIYAYILLCAKINKENLNMGELAKHIMQLASGVDVNYLKNLLKK